MHAVMFLFFCDNHSTKSFYFSVEGCAVSFRRSFRRYGKYWWKLKVFSPKKKSAFEKNTLGCLNISDDWHKIEREMCPATISVNRLFFMLLVLPILKIKIQREQEEPCKIHTLRQENQTHNHGGGAMTLSQRLRPQRSATDAKEERHQRR